MNIRIALNFSMSEKTKTAIVLAAAADTAAKDSNDSVDSTTRRKKYDRYDPDFDRELSDEMIMIARQNLGCFCCGKQDADRKCSRCKVATYCNRECQKKDWRHKTSWRGPHKAECEVFCDNRAQDESIIFCLRSCCFITEEEFIAAVIMRREYFLSMISSLPNEVYLHMQSSVIEILGTICLVGAVSFFDVDSEEVRFVKDMMIHSVEDATVDARAHLYNGSGTLSTATRTKVVAAWMEFAERAHYYGIRIQSITFGRGMLEFVDDENFKQKLSENGMHDVMCQPSTDYAFSASFPF